MDILPNVSPQVEVFITSFIIAIIVGPIAIPVLRRMHFGQTVRDDGPKTHLKKTGTPIMGGFIFIIPIILMSLLMAGQYPQIIPLMLTTVGCGTIGFIDDYLKAVKKRKDGLYAGQKMFGLVLVATVFAFYVAHFTNIGTDIIIPFMGMDVTIDLVWLYIPITVFVTISSANSFNLTDGLDGLLAGITLIILVFFTVVAMSRPEWDYIKMFTAIAAGGCLGFLAFNIHPARVFMGDMGSLALGGAAGATAVMMKMPLILIIVAGICVLETLSVMIQVTSFKLTGKRVFRMAPIHHHFELSGWKETKVVAVFWTVTVILCFIGFLALKLRVI